MLFDPVKLLAALTDPTLLPQLKSDVADVEATVASITKLVADIEALLAKFTALKVAP